MPKKKKGGGKKKGKSKKAPKDSSAGLKDFYQPPPKSPEESLHDALKRMRWWIEEEHVTIDRYFDQCGKGVMSSEEFVSVLRYLQAPISSKQTDLVLKYLDDLNSGFIEIMKFKDLHLKDDRELMKIAFTTSLVEPVNEDKLFDEESEKGKKRKKKGDKVQGAKETKVPGKQVIEFGVELHPRYVELKLILATFKELKKHPAHFTTLVTVSTTIHGVSQLIKSHLNGAVSSVVVFKDSSCSKESYLNPSWSLESCGVEGSPLQYEPTKNYQLFYDYIPDFLDSPLLMADNELRHIPLNSLKI